MNRTHDNDSRRRTASLAALLALVTMLLPAPALAADGVYTQILCANPDTGRGLGVPAVDGLSTPASASAWRATITGTACSSGPRAATDAIALGPAASATVPYNGYAAVHYSVGDPALTIDSASYFRAFTSGNHPFEVSTRISQHGGTSASDAGTPLSDSFWSGQNQAGGHSDQPFSASNNVSAAHNPRSFSITAQCRDTGGSCAHAPGEWSYRFFGGKVRLRDAQPPQVEAVSGSYFDGSSVTDEQLTFRVSDAGSGIYRFRLELGDDELVEDLTPAQDVTATDRHATCFDVNAENHDPYEFAHQQPCPASLERTIHFDTDGLLDGPAHLRAVVEDAAGNETVIDDRSIEVDNHPPPQLETAALPPVTGTPAVGSTLAGTNGVWRNASTYASYWERCTIESGCVTLFDLPGSTYVPTEADAGARMRHVVYATNDIGEWTAARSPFSEPVAPRGSAPSGGGPQAQPDPGAGPTTGGGTQPAEEPKHPDAGAPLQLGPNGRGATTDARLVLTARGRTRLRTRFKAHTPLTGRLTTSSGEPITGATLNLTARHSAAGAAARPLGTVLTRDDGTFSYTLPSGPSRRVEVAYRASLNDTRPAASARVQLVVPAALSLRVQPARPGRTTWMTGRLRHLPRAGVQIQMQALDGRRWRTFDTTTTKRGGRFRYGYRFKPTAAGRSFQLRVVVASPIYPFARGASRPTRIRVPR
jgi:hypothetical protein